MAFYLGGTSVNEFLLQRNIDLVARFAREKCIADPLCDPSAATRTLGSDRDGRDEEIGRIVIARALVTLTVDI